MKKYGKVNKARNQEINKNMIKKKIKINNYNKKKNKLNKNLQNKINNKLQNRINFKIKNKMKINYVMKY